MTAHSPLPSLITLRNGVPVPQLGFGVFQVADHAECEEAVSTALRTGYRLVDTAACYGNEAAVGAAIRSSDVPREEVMISSKVWIQDAGYKRTRVSFDKTLENLGTDYLDLYLIHMPYGDYHGSWRAMEELYRTGRVKAIGVSNFLPDRLVDLIASHEVVPAVNQIEMHPFYQQTHSRAVMEKYGIAAMAWAPFAEGREGIFTNPVLTSIGAAHDASPAQVVLAWLRRLGAIAIPKSVRAERIEQNFAIDGIDLTDEDMAAIASMDRGSPLILSVPAVEEVRRLHSITFQQ